MLRGRYGRAVSPESKIRNPGIRNSKSGSRESEIQNPEAGMPGVRNPESGNSGLRNLDSGNLGDRMLCYISGIRNPRIRNLESGNLGGRMLCDVALCGLMNMTAANI